MLASELSFDEIKKIIDIAKSLGCNDIGLSDGEPFMHKDIMKIIDYVSEYPIHILTNGLLINQSIIDHLNSYPNLLIEFRISLDGLDSHYGMRKINYTDVVERIKLLIENNHIVTINTMITENNLDELNSMYDLLQEIGIDCWRLDFIFNAGNANTNHIAYNNKTKLFSILKKLIIRFINEQPNFELDINKVFRSVLLNNGTPLSFTYDSRPCSYQGSLTIRPNGQISFCPSLSITHGNILLSDIDELLADEKWREISNICVKDLNPKCSICQYMPYCGGGCRADAYYETGSLYDISEFTCELIKFHVEEILPLISMYKAQNE